MHAKIHHDVARGTENRERYFFFQFSSSCVHGGGWGSTLGFSTSSTVASAEDEGWEGGTIP